MKRIRVEWDQEEMEKLVDIFIRHQGKTGSDVDVELLALSRELNERADRLGIVHDAKFRNLNGLHMQYKNLKYVETEGKEGLSGASALMREVLGRRLKKKFS